MLQDLVKLKEQPTMLEWISLAKDYHANIEVRTHIKIKDPGSFTIPISINGVFLGDDLCDLRANINLIPMETFRKIKGLRITPTENFVGVVDGSLREPEGVLFDVQVEVENFTFLGDIVVMDMAECPVTFRKTFFCYFQSLNQIGI